MGFFITIEGGEGTGKSMLIASLQQALEQQGRSVVATREPGGTPVADDIRSVLLSSRPTPMEKETEVLLYMASRAEHCRKIIGPALDAGEIVLCDRFSDATVAYQVYGRGLAEAWIAQLNRWASGDRVPTLTLLLDCPVEIALARTRKRGEQTRFEAEPLAFHQRVRDGYLAIARREPERVLVLNAEHPEQLLHQALPHILSKLPC